MYEFQVSNFEVFPAKCEVPLVEWVFSRFTLFFYRSLSARSRNQRNISENLFTGMEGRKHNEDFLREVDQDLLISTGELRRNGFTSTASAKYPTEKDLAGITEGNRRHNMVNCLRTSVRERLQTKFPSSSEKCRASKPPARKKNCL